MSEIVYFIQAGPNGPIKIGKTKDIRRRVVGLQVSIPYKITILAIDSNGNETDYHDKFKSHRLRGEWFDPHPDILSEISRLNELVNSSITIKSRTPAPISKLRTLINKGTLRCSRCSYKMDEELGVCPKCHKTTCHIDWYDYTSKKSCRIFRDQHGDRLNYTTALRLLIEMNNEHARFLRHGRPHKFDIKIFTEPKSLDSYSERL